MVAHSQLPDRRGRISDNHCCVTPWRYSASLNDFADWLMSREQYDVTCLELAILYRERSMRTESKPRWDRLRNYHQDLIIDGSCIAWLLLIQENYFVAVVSRHSPIIGSASDNLSIRTISVMLILASLI